MRAADRSSIAGVITTALAGRGVVLQLGFHVDGRVCELGRLVNPSRPRPLVRLFRDRHRNDQLDDDDLLFADGVRLGNAGR